MDATAQRHVAKTLLEKLAEVRRAEGRLPEYARTALGEMEAVVDRFLLPAGRTSDMPQKEVKE